MLCIVHAGFDDISDICYVYTYMHLKYIIQHTSFYIYVHQICYLLCMLGLVVYDEHKYTMYHHVYDICMM